MSRSQTSSPTWRPFQRSGRRTACAPGRPSGQAMRPSSRTSAAPVACTAAIVVSTIALERLLQVERLGHRLRDLRERLELGDAPLRAVVQLRVLDRLRDLAGDRHEELDLGLAVLARLARAYVQRAFEPLTGQDRDGEDRLVLLLAQVGERLEARIEVRRARDHDRRPLGGGRAGDPLARPHLRDARQVLHAGPERGPQHELARALVVQVDEARVGLERLGDLRGDELEHLADVERRVDRRDRLGDQPQVAGRRIHPPIVRRPRSALGWRPDGLERLAPRARTCSPPARSSPRSCSSTSSSWRRGS